MTRKLNYCFLLLVIGMTACSDLDEGDVKKLLTDANVYPSTVDHRMFCNNESSAKEVMESKLVERGFVTAQLKHTREDIGKPLIYFTTKADPYLLPTNDTLKAFDIQRVKVADEILLQVRNIYINPAGNQAVVDYSTEIVNPTPFAVLYKSDIKGEMKRRTFFTKKDKRWIWNGKIIKLPK